MFKCGFIRTVKCFCKNLCQDFIKVIVYFNWQSTIRHSQILSWLKTINFPYICHELIFFWLYKQCFLYEYNCFLYIEKLNLL